MELRENQIEPVQKGIDFFSNKKPVPSIIVAPTAFGKSIVIAKIAESVNDNLLILQPSKELLEQNFSKYVRLGGEAEIYSASFNIKRIGRVTYATIGSIKNLGLRFKELGFTKMIIDEVHLYPRESDSMMGKFLKESEITHVLGLTATPLKLQTNTDLFGNHFSKLQMLTSRSKKGQFFKDILYVSQIQDMVDLNFWSKLEYEEYYIDNGKLILNSTRSDYTDDSLKMVYVSHNMHSNIVHKINELDDRKSIIVFVPSVAEATDLADKLHNAVAIYASMGSKERQLAISGFRGGKIRTIVNVNILSVGFDHPELDCIICARPTASLAWYYQAMGRGTRIAPNKKDCLIVDYSGNVKKFGKIEKLYYKKENVWKLYGEGGKLLTGIPLHEIGDHTEESQKIIRLTFGKHKGTELKDVPKGYRDWIYREFTEKKSWNQYNEHIKKEIERLNEIAEPTNE